MDVNCTLFVQCFHFGIAYIVLSRYVFKPVVECILQERVKRRALQNAIQISQKTIEELEAKRISAWKHAQTLFGAGIQKISDKRRLIPFSYRYEYEAATDTQVRAHAQRMHDAIMKKVSHDFK